MGHRGDHIHARPENLQLNRAQPALHLRNQAGPVVKIGSRMGRHEEDEGSPRNDERPTCNNAPTASRIISTSATLQVIAMPFVQKCDRFPIIHTKKRIRE